MEGRTFESLGQLGIGEGDMGALVGKHVLGSPELHLKIIFK